MKYLVTSERSKTLINICGLSFMYDVQSSKSSQRKALKLTCRLLTSWMQYWPLDFCQEARAFHSHINPCEARIDEYWMLSSKIAVDNCVGSLVYAVNKLTSYKMTLRDIYIYIYKIECEVHCNTGFLNYRTFNYEIAL